MNNNVRSLKKNRDSLEALLLGLESPPALICITETWLNENDDPKFFLIHGYNQEITKSRTTRGGGVMIQIRNAIDLMKNFHTPFDEALSVEIGENGDIIKIIVIYNPPRTNKMEFIEKLDCYLETESSPILFTIICGDSNIDISYENLLASNYLNIIDSNGFENRLLQGSLIIQQPVLTAYCSKIYLSHIYQSWNIKTSLITIRLQFVGLVKMVKIQTILIVIRLFSNRPLK